MSMGVDTRDGDKSPPDFGAGDCPPPDSVVLQNFKHQITCITM